MENRPNEVDARSAGWTMARLAAGVNRPLTLLATVLAVVQALAGTVSIISTAIVIGALPETMRAGLDSPAGHRLFTALAIGAGAVWALYVLPPFQTAVADSLGRKLDGSLRRRVMRAACTPAGVAHLEEPEVLDRIRDAQGVGEGQFTPGGAIGGVFLSLGHRLSAVAAAVLLASFEWWLGVWVLVASILLRRRLVADAVTAAATGAHTQDLRRADYLRTLALAPEAAKELGLFRLGPWVLRRFVASWTSGMEIVWSQRHRALRRTWPWALTWASSIVASLYVGGRATAEGELNLQSLVIVIQAVISASYVWFGTDDVKVAHAAASVSAVEGLERTLALPAHQLPGTAAPPDGVTDGIRFENVTFRYPNQSADVLSELDLFIPAGRSLAIVGSNGAGKTTLVKLLARLHDPTGGRITVDGTPLTTMEPKAWQRRVASIFQDFVRYEMSVADNVALGALERAHDPSVLAEAALGLSKSDFIGQLPHGWETILSRRYPGGAELSGGEWQRLALGRALFAVHAGAQLLVLDEPTASLDPRAEAELFDNLLDLTPGITTILLSHRFSSVRRADSICVLENGRVAALGSHDTLMFAGGQYAAMFGAQAECFSSSNGNGGRFLVDSLSTPARGE